ncbi:DUF3662 and FHA domain-containing protein [Kribbella sp. NBC_00482]|uniref:DUF3662 and FHA domain-containing protein n=1 Tax=Kribbella sp. NBC_00482 TaxID=2975968 RepID=UPI002E17EB34
MRPLQRFERRLEGIVSGVFARAFKGDVEPIELAAALKREIDNTARILSRDRRLVPNHFTIELGPDDFERLNAYGRTLNHELANELRDHADIQRYTFSGPIDIELVQQDELPTGKFRVVSETLGTPQRRPEPYQQPEPQPYQQEPYVPPNPPPVVPQYQQPQPPAQQQQPRRGHPQVMLEVNGRRRPVNPPGVVLGRGTDADIQINDPGVSRRHAEIRLMPEGPGGIRVVMVDLGSTNGTLVNGRRTTEAELVDGSTVRIGNTTMTLRLADEPMAQPPSSGW